MFFEVAKAKLNLTLRVLGRRGDGYHELRSLVAFADVGDTVTFEPGATARVVVDGPFAQAIDGENLLDKTLRLVRQAVPSARLGSVRLTKTLPVAAGLGGGSADAAAVLRAMLRAEPELAMSADIAAIARQLGADVTVCLQKRPSLMWGVGEQVAFLDPLPPFWVVLANPGVPLSTADVFRDLRAPPLDHAPSAPSLPVYRRLDDLVADMRAQGNDLQAPGLRLCPQIGDVLAALRATAECLHATQSGSGPTCFGVFAHKAPARAAAADLANRNPGWWIAAASCG